MKKKKWIKRISLSLGTLLVIGFIIISIFTGISVFNGSMQMVTNETTSMKQMEPYLEEQGLDLAKFRSEYSIETVQITSSLDGHLIPADYITRNGDKDADTVIMVHGLNGNRTTVYPIATLFLENGYNVLAYDQRSSGDNTAPYTTFGYLESHDLKDYVAYVREQIGEENRIGVWGTSFGGATVGIYLGSEEADKEVGFAILDCPISEMEFMLSTKMEEMDVGIPIDYLMFTGNITTKLKLGFTYEDANVCNYTSNTKVPVIIINSKSDIITPYFMGEDIYQSIPHEQKKIFTVEDSKHAEVFFDYPAEYTEQVLQFITQ
ncbi:alpha/beta hydrolase [Rubeoparvulum massiliense]|uniref:alpha/beta hydrolase n=1 Tax=Rubeoparvulum massiliense TaxID=1631346 RepID=UPI00065E950C|nr:alpha/beta hydrolase [Rubeoparvulum massiliense]